MAISQTRRGTVVIRPQTESSGAGSSYTLPFASGDMPPGDDAVLLEADITLPEPALEIFERDAVRGSLGYTIDPVEGSKYGGTISLKFPLKGWTNTAAASIAANPFISNEMSIISQILGGVLYQAGSPPLGYGYQASAVAAGSDSNTVKIESAKSIDAYKVGAGLILEDASADYRIGFIQNAIENDGGGSSDHTVELSAPLSETGSDFATPNTGTNTFGCVTGYMSNDAPTANTILWRSAETNTQLLCESAVLTSVSLSLDPRANLVAECVFACRRIVADVATPGSLSYAYDATTDRPVLPPAMGNNGARLVYSTNGTTATAFDVESLSIEMTQEIKPQLSHGAAEGCAGVIVTSRSVSMSVTGLLGNASPWDASGDGVPPLALSNATPPRVMLQLGSAPGNMVGFFMPRALQSALPKVEDRDSVLAVTYDLKPGNYTSDTATDAGNSSFRMAIG